MHDSKIITYFQSLKRIDLFSSVDSKKGQDSKLEKKKKSPPRPVHVETNIDLEAEYKPLRVTFYEKRQVVLFGEDDRANPLDSRREEVPEPRTKPLLSKLSKSRLVPEFVQLPFHYGDHEATLSLDTTNFNSFDIVILDDTGNIKHKLNSIGAARLMVKLRKPLPKQYTFGSSVVRAMSFAWNSVHSKLTDWMDLMDF